MYGDGEGEREREVGEQARKEQMEGDAKLKRSRVLISSAKASYCEKSNRILVNGNENSV